MGEPFCSEGNSNHIAGLFCVTALAYQRVLGNKVESISFGESRGVLSEAAVKVKIAKRKIFRSQRSVHKALHVGKKVWCYNVPVMNGAVGC